MQPLADVIDTYTRAVAEQVDRDALLDELLLALVRAVPADGAGLMLPDQDGVLRFAAATDDRVEGVELEQASAQQGACHEAYVTATVVTVADLDEDERWPAYRKRCEEAGFRAVAGVPLTLGDETLGACNIYRSTPGAWADQDTETSAAVGQLAAAAIIDAGRRDAVTDRVAQLQHALDARVVIEQAKGYLMAAGGLDEHDALRRMRIEARNAARPLRDVAQRVLDRARPVERRPPG